MNDEVPFPFAHQMIIKSFLSTLLFNKHCGSSKLGQHRLPSLREPKDDVGKANNATEFTGHSMSPFGGIARNDAELIHAEL